MQTTHKNEIFVSKLVTVRSNITHQTLFKYHLLTRTKIYRQNDAIKVSLTHEHEHLSERDRSRIQLASVSQDLPSTIDHHVRCSRNCTMSNTINVYPCYSFVKKRPVMQFMLTLTGGWSGTIILNEVWFDITSSFISSFLAILEFGGLVLASYVVERNHNQINYLLALTAKDVII